MKASNHNEAIPADVINTMENALDEQLNALVPYATPLTPDDRRNLLKLGPKTFEFVELAHTVAKQTPQLLSRSFDMEAFDVDWQDAHNLMGLETKARRLLEQIEDIRMVSGSEAYHRSLDVYTYTKLEAARNEPDAKTVYEDLKAAYPVRRRRHRETETEQAGK